jgi:hypothetical protein
MLEGVSGHSTWHIHCSGAGSGRQCSSIANEQSVATSSRHAVDWRANVVVVVDNWSVMLSRASTNTCVIVVVIVIIVITYSIEHSPS